MNLSDHPATRIAWKIRDVHHQHMHQLRNILQKFNLYAGQPRILFIISHLKNATQREIAAEMNVSPPSLSMSIKRMQKAGLLIKTQDADDLRSNRIELSDRGREIDAKIKENLQDMDKNMLKGFSEAEIRQLQSMLDRMYENISTYEGDR